MLGWRLSDNGFFPLGRRVLGDNDQREMELINISDAHILETHCNLSRQTVPALSLLWAGPGERRGMNSSKSVDSHKLGQRQWEQMQEVWAGSPRSSLRGAVQRHVVGVLWQVNHVKWTECWKQKLQKALYFSLTALDCVTSTNYLGLKGFGGFLFCFLLIK